jgi:hypothetical protein
MDIEQLQKTFLPHLRSQFEQGQAVLFVGAGFSLGAKNASGNPLPDGRALAREYWKICYPAKDFEESTTLQDIYEAAHLRHQAQLKRLTIDRLTVDANTLPDWYKPYVEMPWLRIYSLNIDDLLESAGRRWPPSRRIAALSATSTHVSQRPPASADAVELVHLNGTLADLPDDVTFSVSQYAERLANNDPWYAQLVTDLLTRSIVFIGSSLDESPLWQHVVLRAGRGGRQQFELRHRSYLVSPALSAARQALLSQHNVEWLPFGAEEFSARVLNECRVAIPTGLKVISEKYPPGGSPKNIRLPVVSDLASRTGGKTEYLLGEEPTWSDIQSGRAVERDADEALLTTAKRLLTAKPNERVLVVTGTAGSGKSTSLMRLCLKLSSFGTVVGFIDRNLDISLRNVRRSMDVDTAPKVLAIEDADLYGSELVPLVRDLLAMDRGTLIILEIRSGKIDRAFPQDALSPSRITEMPMPPVSDRDIDAILGALDRENRLGKLKGMAKGAQIEAFRQQAGRELIVAMYQATTGLDFKTKMVQELEDLTGTARFIYALIALTSAHRFPMTQDEVVIAVADRSNSVLNEIRTLLSRHLIVRTRDDTGLQARHRVIASVLFEALTTSGQLFDLIYGVVIAAVSKYRESEGRGSRASRMMQTFLNHDFLGRTLGLEQTRNLYGRCESLLRDNYHYWLHRGAIEVEHGDLSLAENFLSQAKGLAPSDPFVLNEWAYLLFRKAIESPASPEAQRYVGEALDILNGLISNRAQRSAHAYHVLGSQALAWSRRGIGSKLERGEFLLPIKTSLSQACETFPDNADLRQLEQDVQKEILKLAVPR